MLYNYQPQPIAGKGVVISGGTTGLGRAMAIRLAGAGAKVLIFGRNAEPLDEALADIQQAADAGGGQVFGITADHGNLADVARVFAEADAKLGTVNILINNAAVAAESIAETPIEEAESVLRSNLLGYLACTAQAIPRMKAAKDGHIINIGSMSAHEREAGSDIYVATKGAVEAWSESLHKQISKDGLKVCLIEPGLVGSDMTVDKVPVPEQPAAIAAEKMLHAEDLAECVYYVVTQPHRVNLSMIRIEPRNPES